jgi:hypothetical protein
MKRWYVFFLLVAVLTALAGLGVFSDGTLQQQTSGAAGRGKLLFLTLLGVVAVSYAGWLAFTASRKRKLGSGNDDRPSHPDQPDKESDGAWQPPPREQGSAPDDVERARRY